MTNTPSHLLNGMSKSRCIAVCYDVMYALRHHLTIGFHCHRAMRQTVANNYDDARYVTIDRLTATYAFIEAYYPGDFDAPMHDVPAAEIMAAMLECSRDAGALAEHYRKIPGEPAFVPTLMAAE